MSVPTASAPTAPLAGPRALLMALARANLLLALSVAASAWMVQTLAGLPVEPVSPLVAFLTMYAVYSLDRASEPEADSRTHPERASFSGRHARLLRGSALAAYAVALLLAGTRGWWSVAVALLPLAVVLVYSFPFLPAPLARRVGFSRLKEVLVLKNVVVALTLAGTPTLLPAAAAGGAPAWRPVVAVGAFLFGRWWINTVLFDVRDEHGDRENGVRTLVVVLGGRTILRLLRVANAALAVLAVAAPLLGWAPPLFAVLAAGSLYAGIYLRRMETGDDPHFLCDVVSDGELLVLAALLAAARAALGG
ncbi:MAG TPA: UbiA family prenyltransferase [Longimicrobiaceae bacterium]